MFASVPPTNKLKAKKNPSLERQILAYPKPRYYKMFVAYASLNIYKRSEAACDILKKFFDGMSIMEQNKLLTLYDELTPDERRWTGREVK